MSNTTSNAKSSTVSSSLPATVIASTPQQSLSPKLSTQPGFSIDSSGAITPLRGTSSSTELFTDDATKKPERLSWNDHTEELLAQWGDHASCYKYLHDKSYLYYNNINWWIAVPVGVFSTISGTASVGMSSLVPAEYVDLGQKIVGAVNIVLGVMTGIQSQFRFAQKGEAHQNCSIGWAKLERMIRTELKMPRNNRKDADNFIRQVRNEYDRLSEQSQGMLIPKGAIKKFRAKFGTTPHLEQPDVVGKLRHTVVTKPPIDVPDTSEPVITDHDLAEEDDKQTAILQQIKDMLSESRLVNIGTKDYELPYRQQQGDTSNHKPSYQATHHFADKLPTIKPRKSFLGVPPDPIDIVRDRQSSVKELMKRFERPIDERHNLLPSNIKASAAEKQERAKNNDVTITITPSTLQDQVAVAVVPSVVPEIELIVEKVQEANIPSELSNMDNKAQVFEALHELVDASIRNNDKDDSLKENPKTLDSVVANDVQAAAKQAESLEERQVAPVIDLNDLL